MSRRPVQLWALVAIGVHGAVMTLLLWALALVGDRTALTYSTGVLAFWLLLPAVAGIVVAGVMRSRVVVLTAFVPAVVWVLTFGPMFWPQQAAPAPPSDLRVVTFNVSPDDDIKHLLEFAEDVRPDVLLLQEVLPKAQRRLDRRLPGLPYRHYSPVAANAPGGGGVAVLSSFPIVGVEPVGGLPTGARPTDVVTLDVRGTAVPVVSVHLTSPDQEVMVADAREGRLGALLADPPSVRRVAEAEAIARALPQASTLVVGGDLNSSYLNQPLRLLAGRRLTDTHRAAGSGPGFTRGSSRDVARIDFVLVGDDLTPVRSVEAPPYQSDHRPVVADLSLSTERPSAATRRTPLQRAQDRGRSRRAAGA